MQPSGSGGVGRAFVRVLGTRRNKYVELSFALGDPELAVELILPLDAFEDLCARHGAELLTPEPAAARAFAELKRRTQP